MAQIIIIEDEVLMDRNILHFSSNGEYKNFIGLEGIGGQPFPYIENIWISELSELIVLYRTRKGPLPEMSLWSLLMQTCLLVPEKNPDAIADKIHYLINNPKLWPEMGEFGRDFVLKNFNINLLNQKLIQYFSNLSTRLNP